MTYKEYLFILLNPFYSKDKSISLASRAGKKGV